MISGASKVIRNVSSWAYSWVKSPDEANPNDSNTRKDDSCHEALEGLPPKPPYLMVRKSSEVMSTLMTSAQWLWTIISPKDPQAFKLWNQLCHKMDIAYPPKDQLQAIDVYSVHGKALMDEMQYNMRLAFLAYPPSLVAVFSEALSVSFRTQKGMLMECLDISEEDILIDRCTLKRTRSLSNLMNKAHEPAFFVALDHKQKAIVLSIRGTSSIGDIVTDFNHEPREYQTNGITGYIHEGLFHGAQFVHKLATNTLINACQQYGEYHVVITGHSMGAGAAALLGLMYKDNSVIRGEDGKRLKVWCFASPCVATREFTDEQVGNDYITSVTLGIDMVCRMTMESVKKWNMRQELISAYPTENIQRFLQFDDTTSSASDGASFSTILKTLKARNPEELFFPLGRILWFVPPIVMHDDIALRRRTLMKMSDKKVDGNHGQIQLQQMKNMMHHIDDHIDDEFGDDEDADDAAGDLEDSCENEEEQKVDLFTIRKRPMYQSSDEDDDQEFDAIPLSETAQKDTTTSSTNQRVSESAFVLCDATKCRDIFQEFVHEYPSSLTTHLVSSYMKACGATLKNDD